MPPHATVIVDKLVSRGLAERTVDRLDAAESFASQFRALIDLQ
jgi:hypothetical protein